VTTDGLPVWARGHAFLFRARRATVLYPASSPTWAAAAPHSSRTAISLTHRSWLGRRPEAVQRFEFLRSGNRRFSDERCRKRCAGRSMDADLASGALTTSLSARQDRTMPVSSWAEPVCRRRHAGVGPLAEQSRQQLICRHQLLQEATPLPSVSSGPGFTTSWGPECNGLTARSRLRLRTGLGTLMCRNEIA